VFEIQTTSISKKKKDLYLDQRVGKNEGKYFFRSLPTQKFEKKLFLFYRSTDPYFSHDLLVEQQITFVSPFFLTYRRLEFESHIDPSDQASYLATKLP